MSSGWPPGWGDTGQGAGTPGGAEAGSSAPAAWPPTGPTGATSASSIEWPAPASQSSSSAWPGVPASTGGATAGAGSAWPIDDTASMPQPGAPTWPGVPSFGPPMVSMPSSRDVSASGPPWVWLGLALVLPTVVGLVSLFALSTWERAVAWALICAGGFGCLMVFTLKDVTSRGSASYIARDDIVALGRVVVILVTLAFSVLSAWLFADWFARLPVFLGMG